MLYENEDMTILRDNFKLIQKVNGFRFSVDAVILSDFFNPHKDGKVLDIGTGNGIIPILLYAKNKSRDIVGIDIQEENSSLAIRNIELNKLEEYIEIVNYDVKEYPFGNSFDSALKRC